MLNAHMKIKSVLFLLLLLPWLAQIARADIPGGDSLWFASPPAQAAVDLYFFWSRHCPHCRQAQPYMQSLEASYPWIRLHSHEIAESLENRARFEHLAETIGIVPSSVPTFMWCGKHYTGYQDADSTGRILLEALADCYREHYAKRPPGLAFDEAPEPGSKIEGSERIEVPWFDDLDPSRYSLPTLAIVLGGIDAFNPCAFFILLFLLSLLVNTRNRGRMLLVGGIFVLTSGVVYFAFMAAWLNLFQLLDKIAAITLVAGCIAIAIGVINIRDYFQFQRGASLSLSSGQKSKLFSRMRALVSADHFAGVFLGTMALALAANSYELLCTMGLPMIFTRVLTLEQLPSAQYYAYLGLYNLVYITPLALIVGLFVASMGRRKLSENEGRFLKLLSGNMMGGLGLVLVLSPEQLSSPLQTIGLISAALAVTFIVHFLYQQRTRP